MPTLTPTKDKGAATKPVGALYVEPERAMTDDMLAALFEGTDLNGPFVADLLSAMLTHERCGRHLYRSVEGRTHNPKLKAKYREFGEETERHVEILEDLITQMGGNPNYVSPSARALEGTNSKILESTFALSGSIDMMTAEMAMLDAVFLAESVDHANWSMFTELASMMPDGPLRASCVAAAATVEDEEDEHLGWAKEARRKLTLMQARSSMLARAGGKGEEMVARIKGWFSE